MDTLITASTIAAPTIALVAMVKVALPEAKSWVYMLSSLLAGLVIAILMGMATGGVVSPATSAQWVLNGFSAAVLASGTHQLDSHAGTRRASAKRARAGLPLRRADDPAPDDMPAASA